MLPDEKSDVFAAFLLTLCSMVFLNIVFPHIHFKRFFLNLKRLSNGKVVLLTKKEYGSAAYFYKF